MQTARPLTILLLEDDPVTGSMMRWTLEQAGYLVLTVTDGDAAFRQCVEHQGGIDLLIADVNVPGTNGLDVVRVVQEECPHLKVLPCSGEYESIREAVEALQPRTPFLKTPFDAETLLKRVRDTFDAAEVA
jgi:DNA-binding response OmpR family regulator